MPLDGRTAATGRDASLDLLGSSSSSDLLAADEPAPASLELARLAEGRARARTALLRTAMELAALSSLAHPNLLQVGAVSRCVRYRMRHVEYRCSSGAASVR